MNEKPQIYLEVDFSRINQSRILELLDQPGFGNTKSQTVQEIYRALLCRDGELFEKILKKLRDVDPTAYTEIKCALEADGQEGIIRINYCYRS